MAFLYQRGSHKPMSEINVVPFIDVMLVLLVIFMITTPLLTQGVKVDLPKTAAQELTEQEPIIVTVDDKGNFYLNVAEKPSQALNERTLSQLATTVIANESKNASQPQRAVLVRGDKNVNYGRVMEAMVLLQKAGAKSVGLITQAPEKVSS